MNTEIRKRRPITSLPEPMVSIITVVYEDCEELQDIITNVQRFRGQELELIVVDGGSSDGTVDFLESYPALTDYWISERDRGIYDAMNKGLEVARGIYVLHINAGDRLLEIPWKELEESAAARVDVISCIVRMDGLEEFVPRISFTSKIDNTWHHQGTFYRRVAHLGYDETFRICGDFDHNQRLLRKRNSVRLLGTVVSDHRNDGLSTQEGARKEIYRSIYKNYGAWYVAVAKLRFLLAPLWMRFMHKPKLQMKDASSDF